MIGFNKIFAKYEKDFEAASCKSKDCVCKDIDLFKKYQKHIPEGWYGFDLGLVPQVWLDIIDEFLTELIKDCPNLEIHQIKIKSGRLRFNVANQDDNAFNQINQLEEKMHHNDLIY